MTNRIAKTAVMLALTALSTVALAQDTLDTEPPGRVGRVALTQGKVSISSGVGDTATEALINWPVTTRNLITTEQNGRTEVRVGSTAIRVDRDSSLEITELDDDSVRLRLHYGSASIRILSEDVLPEFELSTPQGRVRMLKTGRLRVDAERVRDTTVVNVFDGEAQVDGGGASLTIRAGRSAELRDDDVRTLQASRDGFDDWALERDRLADGSRSARYVTTEMTGYEELDRHGIWQDDLEYGALWIPSVSTSWVPYRDGRWTWVAPWGWTWVDNAPWGYAPFHYGRWVHHKNRWAWAPGRHDRRPVWAPALVGWVGGSGWNVNFNLHGSRPATGWYPLGPRDHFVPGYRLSDERLRRMAWRDRRGDGPKDGRDRDGRDGPRGRDRDGDGKPDYRQRGLTVVPHANFGGRAPVVVSNVPRATPPAVPNAVGSAPPAPQGWRDRNARRDGDRDGIPDRVDRDRDGDGIPNRVDRDQDGDGIRNRADRDRDGDGLRNRVDRDRDGDGIPNRFERDNRDNRYRDRFERPDRGQRPPVLSTNPAPRAPVAAAPMPAPVQPGVIATAPPPAPAVAPPSQQPSPRIVRDHDREQFERADRELRIRGDRGERYEGRRERPQPMAAMPQPAMQAPAPRPQMAPAPVMAPPPPQAMAPPPPRPMAAPAPSGPPPERQRSERRSQDHGGVREQER